MKATLRVGAGVSAVLLVLAFAGACETVDSGVDQGVAAARERATEQPAEREVTDLSTIVPVFAESRERYDDKIGFEEFELVVAEDAVEPLMGDIRRRFFQPEDGRSPLEISLYYQEFVENEGGTILFQTRDPLSVEVNGEELWHHFSRHREDRGLSTYVWDFTHFRGAVSEYIGAVIPTDQGDLYFAMAAGRGDGSPRQFSGTRFEIVTVVVD